MATISTAIEVHDKVSRPINMMVTAITHLCNAFDTAESSLDSAFDTSAVQQARSAIAQCAKAVTQLESNTDRVEDEQRKYNRAIQDGSGAMSGLISKVGGLVTSYASLRTIGATVKLSDEMAQTTARFGMLVEGEEEVLALKEKIYQSAQRSRGAYQETANSVAKLGLVAGKAFSGTDEIIAFAETLNKNFVVGGASATEQASAMYQLTQAMGSGRLQGDEYRSIIENAPLLAKAIEDYMVNVQGAKGTMKEWASEGKLTANVIKAAVFKSAEDVEQRFNEMPMTWNQIWTKMKNTALMKFQPVLDKINNIANNKKLQKGIIKLTNAFSKIATVAVGAINVISEVASFMYDNWSYIEPIIFGVVGALATYRTTLLITKGIEMAVAVAKGLMAAAQWACTSATWAEVTAQWGLNAAMYSCPLVWIIALIFALIAVILLVVVAMNKAAGKSVSVAGIICGAFAWLAATTWNITAGSVNSILQFLWASFAEPIVGIIEWILNVCNGGFDSFGGAVANLIGQIISWFLSLGQVVTKIIDAIFGTNWTAGLTSLQNKVLAWGKNENAITLDRNAPELLKRVDATDAYNAGYSFGENVADKFNPDEILSNLYGLVDNTDDMKDSMEIASEDLKYLRDIAEREVINRFTTAEIKVEMTNNNSISSEMDLDGIVDYLVVGVNDAMARTAEGVHI